MRSKLTTVFLVVLLQHTFLKNITLGADNSYFLHFPTTQHQNLNPVAPNAKLWQQLASTLDIIVSTTTEFQKTKREYVNEVVSILEEKLKRSDLERQNSQQQLIDVSKAFMQAVINELANIKKEIKEELLETQKEIMLNNYQNIRNHVAQLKRELTEQMGKFATQDKLENINNNLIQTQLEEKYLQKVESLLKEKLQVLEVGKNWKETLEEEFKKQKEGIEEELLKTKEKITLDLDLQLREHLAQLENEFSDKRGKLVVENVLEHGFVYQSNRTQLLTVDVLNGASNKSNQAQIAMAKVPENVSNESKQTQLPTEDVLKNASSESKHSQLSTTYVLQNASNESNQAQIAIPEVLENASNESKQTQLPTEDVLKNASNESNQAQISTTDVLENASNEPNQKLPINNVQKSVNNESNQTLLYSSAKANDLRPQDCRDVQKNGARMSGIYTIYPQTADNGFRVWCDLTTQNGGWTYVLNRFNGEQNFYLNWTDYRQGFGSLSAEHWLGLQHLYELTSNKPTELLFELVDWNSIKVYAIYDNFVIGNETEDYLIKSVGKYVGNAGDSFRRHVGDSFSTADYGRFDSSSSSHCATYFRGAWWYHESGCCTVHLTGVYSNKTSSSTFENAIHWHKFNSNGLKEVKMMIRPRED